MPNTNAALPALSRATTVEPLAEKRPITWQTRHKAVLGFTDLQPGDLVLVKADSSNIGSAIKGVQGSLISGAHPHGDPNWTHVGIYVDDGIMLEAVPKLGVRYCTLEKYAITRDIRVRRLVHDGAAVTKVDGIKVVRVAADFFEKKYSMASIAAHLFSPAKVSSPSAFFCSTFIAVVYAKALKTMLDSDAFHRPLFPATLAKHPSFIDIPVVWRSPA